MGVEARTYGSMMICLELLEYGEEEDFVLFYLGGKKHEDKFCLKVGRM